MGSHTPVGSGGIGVFKLKIGDTNSLVTLELLSKNFSEEIMLQSYVSAASSHGDKRILLLNGEILGSVLRVASSEDHRNNFFYWRQSRGCKNYRQRQTNCSRIITLFEKTWTLFCRYRYNRRVSNRGECDFSYWHSRG